MKTTYKILRFIAIIILAISFNACSTEAWKEGNSDINSYLYFDPENPEIFFIARGIADLKQAIPTDNGTVYEIYFEENSSRYIMKVTTSEEVHGLFFSGFNYNKYLEQNWKKEGESYILESSSLLPPIDGYYRLMVGHLYRG